MRRKNGSTHDCMRLGIDGSTRSLDHLELLVGVLGMECFGMNMFRLLTAIMLFTCFVWQILIF